MSATAPQRSPLRRAGRVALVAAIALVSGITSMIVTTPDGGRAVAAPTGAGGEYHAIDPARILDTRLGVGSPAPSGPATMLTGDGASFSMQVLGEGGLPSGADDVLAVVANVTVTGATSNGYLRIFGTGGPEGTSSLVNFQAGQTVPNLTILRPGDGGMADVRLVSEGTDGTAHVLVDVFGWFSTDDFATRGARLIAAGPGRIFDSRNAAIDQLDGAARPFGTGEWREVPFRGADAINPTVTDIVPSSESVIGALVNVTAVNAGPGNDTTFVSLVPERTAGDPTTSNLNLAPGQTKANLVLVPVGPDGSFHVFNERGANELIIDVVAYLETGYASATTEGRVVPLVSPYRAIDTRQGAFGSRPLGEGQAEDWSFQDFAEGVAIDDVPVGEQSALLGNLTATGLTPTYEWDEIQTYMTAYPATTGEDDGPPEASNVNLPENASVPNMVLMRYGTGVRDHDDDPGTPDIDDPYMVRVYNYAGSVHYILDVSAVVLAESD